MTDDQLKRFFSAVITTKEGYLLIARGDGLGGWWEEFFLFPNNLDDALDYIRTHAPKYNMYFSAHLFNSADSHKSNALPSRTIQADLDDADPETSTIKPNILVETSHGRHQAYWILEETIALDILENHSRNITYSIPLCDRSGWTIGHRMRIPLTQNYKRSPIIETIQVVEAYPLRVTLDALEQLPAASSLALEHYDQGWLDSITSLNVDVGPQELLESIRTKIPTKVYAGYNIPQEDRSAYIWSLCCAAFRTGLNKDSIFWLAKHSINNKFNDLKYNADLELAKDVLRAQEAIKSQSADVKTSISAIRKQKGHSADKRQMIAKIVIDRLRSEGTFIHADNGTLWYVRKDIGRPIQISRVSDYLSMLLAIEFGLNAVESEQHYVRNELESYTLNTPQNGVMCALSYYNSTKPDTVYLHTGRQQIIQITPETLADVPQGYNNMLFPWNASVESFTPSYDYVDWGDFLFADSLKNIIDISPECSMAMLKTWLIFVLFRNAAISRPILAFIGQPGGGKSTLFKKIYVLLYGRKRAVTGVTTKEDFDHAVSTDSLVVLDGLDSLENWLPDRLSLIASSSDIIRRKLFTDIDTVIIRRQAIMGVTSHNPQFSREDIADRMLVFNFKRIADNQRVADSVLLDGVAEMRNQLWGSIILDLQKILANPIPVEYPAFRIEDFSRIGTWIAQGLGIQSEFNSGIDYIRDAQARLVLDEDQLLVDALLRYVTKQNGNLSWESPATLWVKLESLTPNPLGFRVKYKSAAVLGRKLTAFAEPLKKLLFVDQRYDQTRGSRIWLITRKKEEVHAERA